MTKEEYDRLAEQFTQWHNISEMQNTPGELYVLDTNAGVRTIPGLYLAVDPALLFTPDPKLVALKWWQVVKL